MRGTILLGCFAGLTDGYAAGINDAMHRHARQHLAARTADRTRGYALVRERIARRIATLEAAKVAAGIAASETDPGLHDLLAAFADVPVFVADADPDFESEADATWLDKPVRVGIWHDVMRQTTAAIAATLITSILHEACNLIAHWIVQTHQRAAHLSDILARAARDSLSALAHARLRVAHICITARAMRAGRAVALASAAHAQCC